MTLPSLNDIVSCISGYDPHAMTVERAQAVIREFIHPIEAVEKLPIRSALSRVLAQDIVSRIDVPAHDNSAMDGYALRGEDLAEGRELRLQIIGEVHAGDRFTGQVGPGQCVRIMTGAPMPAGCDTVIPQELTVDADQSAVTVPPGRVRAGDNRRLRGEDLALGSVALPRGRILRPSDIGLLASLGLAEAPVQRRLRVAFFSTGDELRSVGEPLDEGCVYDSNRYTLHGMLTRLGCEVLDMGVVPDDPAALEAAFRSACEEADAVITSGGVSVGAADYTKQIMASLGEMAFWKIAMRPGRPLAFGRIRSRGREAYLFGLPGNPVAVTVSFSFFVRDALLRLAGAEAKPLPRLRVKTATAIRKKAGRTEYQRGILAPDDSGNWSVRLTGMQGSGILRSMSDANCIIELEHDRGDVAAGEEVAVVLFDGLV
ncbi:molybdopterin molybdotransferase MoeA [Herbaspirillum seropedicae]|uniref:Molybdopterin molybdenumtransferase n=1 Tax=Herbaspirillum seropedicae (strain SmR1) TaxID=757424 RepID=D8IRR7_HERSS|nr:gephyrin-like molybdotransferase Glp [Herbaspirillum seropedicae]ADJ63391.1 molybdopterin biosynthesis MoeA protein [Herbaspirillum seropedicae SmR1]AKN65426.1 molybdenum cofactor biosynthesis protein MoaA [Herbaspirillum seropedicae]NQE28587.1 molybdenum cofactor biosynthesis protein MoaA [Herbaspirillum seropedicae]UMU21395.1 molybdopterin molybdotransferase MoeA [Herbaspirillum seropedicae]